MSRSRRAAAALVGALLLLAAGCAKKKPVASTPPPPFQPESGAGAAAPSAGPPAIGLFAAEPSTIERGESAMLRWKVDRASGATLEPGIGTVSPEGSRRVFPSDSTTYRLHATGPGGVADATATVSVTVPPPPPPPAAPASVKTLDERIGAEVVDVYFDYDQYDVRDDAASLLARDAEALKAIFRDFPDAAVVIEGHCDERGSAEYNLGLGDRRASAVRDYLVRLGIPASRLTTISYGKERPQCTEHNEACWQKNRRAHFATRTQAPAD